VSPGGNTGGANARAAFAKSVIKSRSSTGELDSTVQLFAEVSMAKRVVQTNKRLAAERQIHAAIVHFRAGDFECVITLCSAAEGQIAEPNEPTHLFGILRRHVVQHPASDGQKDDFNISANWLKHDIGANEVEIAEWMVTMWLNRAISKYCAIYGIGTPEMTALFPWAGQVSIH
jgi:hypothetical protein